jgi:hypothetical protein
MILPVGSVHRFERIYNLGLASIGNILETDVLYPNNS